MFAIITYIYYFALVTKTDMTQEVDTVILNVEKDATSVRGMH